jgi:hypothetical protein
MLQIKIVKPILKIFICLLASLVLGIGSALWLLKFPPADKSLIVNGPWRTSLAVGSPRAGMYLRAWVALNGLFALNKTETIYFSADTDEHGQPLRSGCDYRVEGGDIAARWWSITVYGADNFLIPNEAMRYAFSSRDIARNADNHYAIALSSTPKTGNWLPSGRQDQLNLSLRLYNPSPEVYQKPGELELPRIIREACR